jgi:hypothetical protein
VTVGTGPMWIPMMEVDMFPTIQRGRPTRFLTAATLLLTSAVFVAGCNDDDNPLQPMTTDGAAEIRVLHLSPDAPAVDVFLNQAMQPAVSGLAFLDGTGYVSLDPGNYRIDVSANGDSPSESVLTVPTVDLQDKGRYTAVAYGTLASIRALALVDDDSNLAASNIRVRAIHTAADVGQVDIWNIPANGSPAVLYSDVDFGVAGGYLDLPAGAYTIGFDVNNDATPDVVFDLPSLPAGTVANVFAVSQSGSVFLVAQLQDGTIARINAR